MTTTETKTNTHSDPGTHLFQKALKLDAQMVVVEKDADAATLMSSICTHHKALHLATGFSPNACLEYYPNNATFNRFIEAGGDPYDLWRMVVCRWLAREERMLHSSDWLNNVAFLKNNPETIARLMQRERGWDGLILFDVTKQKEGDWHDTDDVIRGLLRAALSLKDYNGLYAKALLRKDQINRKVMAFVDSSKLFATMVELS